MRNLSSTTHLIYFCHQTLFLLCFLRWRDLSWTHSRPGCTTKRHNSLLHYHFLFSLSRFLLLTALCSVYVSWSTSPSQQFSHLSFPKSPALPVSHSCVFWYALPYIHQHLFHLSHCSKLPGFQVISNLSKPTLSFTSLKKVCICKLQHYFLPIKIINHCSSTDIYNKLCLIARLSFISILCLLTLCQSHTSRKCLVHIVSDIYLIVTAHWDRIIQHGE